MSGTAAFFHVMAPTLTANILTVTLVYCFAKVAQSERYGEKGRLTYLWLIVMCCCSCFTASTPGGTNGSTATITAPESAFAQLTTGYLLRYTASTDVPFP